jgi:hypothetical protein
MEASPAALPYAAGAVGAGAAVAHSSTQGVIVYKSGVAIFAAACTVVGTSALIGAVLGAAAAGILVKLTPPPSNK